MNKRKTGEDFEEQAAQFLEKQGLQILQRNFRCRLGEIDLIAREGDCYVFVEVKYRKRNISGNAAEAVTKTKQRRICRVAVYYLSTSCHNIELPCRFDVIGFDGEQLCWIRDAFDFCV